MNYPRDINPVLTNNILTSMYNVDEDKVYRQLNTQVYNETAQTFYDKNCDRPISNNEIINYILTKPKRIGKVVYEEPENEKNVIFIMWTLPSFNTRNYYATHSVLYLNDEDEPYVNQDVFDRVTSMDDIIEGVETDILLDMDLMTTYNMYINRKNCMRVNKNYAKQKVIKLFKSHALKTKDFYDTYYYYQYLLLNAFVFDILDRQYEPIQLFFVKPIDMAYENVDEYMENFFNPVDKELYNEQMNTILNAIDELEPKILNYIHNYM